MLPLAYATWTTPRTGSATMRSTQSDVRQGMLMNMKWKGETIDATLMSQWLVRDSNPVHPGGCQPALNKQCVRLRISSDTGVYTSWPANWSSTSRLYGLLQMTAPHRRNELCSCRGSGRRDSLKGHRLYLMVEDRDSPPPLQGESRSRPSNQISDFKHTPVDWCWLVSTCTGMDRTAVVARVISPAYHYISSAYHLRSLGMTGIWKGSRNRSHEMHGSVTQACIPTTAPACSRAVP